MRIKLTYIWSLLNVLPLLLLVAAVVALVMWPRPEVEQTAVGQWTCSMHPQVRMDKPGMCPICGMDLVPAGQLKSQQARLDERAGIETEAVERRELFKEIRTVGKIDYSESRVQYITARIAGRVDRLYVDFTGIDVEHNDHLVDIYSPELVVTQEELLRALEAFERPRSGGAGVAEQFLKSNLESTREKLRLWGILPEQIVELEKTRAPREHVTLYAPMQGTVIEKNVRVGQYVKEGDLLYRIAELDPIWLYLDIYEYDIAWVKYGQRVEVSLEAMPGETVRGTVTFIDPFLDESKRTVRVRVNLPNADRRLKPGMYASASIHVRLNADGSAAPTGLEGKFVCPMHPEVIQDQPGLCTICEMELKLVPRHGPLAHVDPPQNGREADGDHSVHSGTPDQTDNSDHTDHKEHEPESTQETPAAAEPRPADDTHADESTKAANAWPLAIRASAVLDTGRRKITYRRRADGAYELVELTVGPRAVGIDDVGQATMYYVVLGGLQENDEVVVRAGFLLDSQRQIEGMPSLFFPKGAAPPAGHAGHGEHAGHAPAAGGSQDELSDMDKMRTELQKLSPEERSAAERQHICPVTGKMLGTMGTPLQVDVNGRQVWICCSGCKEELLNNAEKYLSKLKEQ